MAQRYSTMHRITTLIVAGFFFLLAACSSPASKTAAERVNDFFIAQADSLSYTIDKFAERCDSASVEELQNSFMKARTHYKRIESLIVFYFPEENERINGPALDKAEEYDDKVILPTGFQVIEEELYADTVQREMLQQHVRAFKAVLNNLKYTVRSNSLRDANVFEAIRLEVLTMMSLGISGFDSPVSFQSIPEAKSSLQGIEMILACYQPADGPVQQELRSVFDGAYQYLARHADFDTFDRATFIRKYLNPLSETLYLYQQELKIPNNQWVSAIKMDKPSFFSKDVYDANFFSPAYNRNLKPEAAVLGKMLFFDPVLSGNQTRSCASCHSPAKAFSDGQTRSLAFDSRQNVLRNAPTLINSVYQKSQFWDQRVHFLEDQVTAVVNNPQEMHGDMDASAKLIAANKEYVALFRKAFGDSVVIDQRSIQTSLAAYIRTLSGLNARFDQYMRGEAVMLTDDELAGFNLFMGKGKCATCHFMPLFNGSVPPQYFETESEVLGVPAKADTIHASVDSDAGKFNTYNRALHKFAFKTPTLRNAALTAPYMHNGVFKTLEEVIDFYNRGGGAGIGAVVPNQTLPADKLNLTRKEQQQIIAFIHTLTDTTGMTRVPSALPARDPIALNKRQAAGRY
jgi:cytochrome c peroxidase